MLKYMESVHLGVKGLVVDEVSMLSNFFLFITDAPNKSAQGFVADKYFQLGQIFVSKAHQISVGE